MITRMEGWRFLVPSSVLGQRDYLVDLAALNGNGECRCKDFATRHHTALKKGEPPSDRTRCKHIKAARREMLEIFVRDINLNPNKFLDGVITGYNKALLELSGGRKEDE
jgi:hypothetical protein